MFQSFKNVVLSDLLCCYPGCTAVRSRTKLALHRMEAVCSTRIAECTSADCRWVLPELLLLYGRLRPTHSLVVRVTILMSPLDSGPAGPPLRHKASVAAEIHDLPYYP